MSGGTILITGGPSGIGLELARQLLLCSNTVIVTGRELAKLDAAQGALPGLHIACSDVSDPGRPRRPGIAPALTADL